MNRKRIPKNKNLRAPMIDRPESYRARFEKDGSLDLPEISSAVRGLQKLYDHFTTINEKRQSIAEGSPHLSEEGKKQAFEEFLEDYEQKINEDIEKVSKMVNQRLEAVSERESEIIAKHANQRHSGNILNHVKGLPDKRKRYSFIKQRIDNEDLEAIEAIFSAPAYLVGIDEELFQELKKYNRDKQFPKLSKIADAYSRVGSSVEAYQKAYEKFKKSLS